MHRTLTTAVLVFSGSVIASASADTITVCGDSECDFTSINAAIAAANDGDVIQLSAETYMEGVVIDTAAKGLTIRGETDDNGAPLTVLSGGGVHRIVNCLNEQFAETVFENLIFRDGVGEPDEDFPHYDSIGGAVYLRYSSDTEFNNCVFESNSAGQGSAVFSEEDNILKYTDCVFRENVADESTIYGREGVRFKLTNCVISENTGKAIVGSYLVSATMTDCLVALNDAGVTLGGPVFTSLFSNCTFRGNRGVGLSLIDQNGYVFSGGPATVTNCRFLDNGVDTDSIALYIRGEDSDVRINDCEFSANKGHAIKSYLTSDSKQEFETHPSISNCSILGNLGGGIYLYRSNATISGCTIACNESDLRGAAIYMYNCQQGSPSLFNNIITGNSTTLAQGAAVAGLGNVEDPSLTGNMICENYPEQVVGNWSDSGGNVLASTCSTPLSEAMDVQVAIDSAYPCTTLLLEEGTWDIANALDLDGKTLAIKGTLNADGDPGSIIQGQGSGRLLTVVNGESGLVFENLVFRNGNTPIGAGVYLKGSSGAPVQALFEHCHIVDNTAAIVAGGVYVGGPEDTCDVTFSECLIRDNTSNGAEGGGLATADYLTTLISTDVCGNINGNTVGEWVDGGGNCIAESCEDADADGTLDACQVASCQGDLDGNGVVDGADLALLLGAWQSDPNGSVDPEYDLNLDGVINGQDLALLLGNWGSCQ